VKFFLDTNAVIALFRGDVGMLGRLQEHQTRDFGIPTVVAHELFYGAFKSERREENLARIDALHFDIVDFTREDARSSGEVRARLALAGTPIGPNDALIAGQALARSMCLITHNTREFERVKGLIVEDWH